MKKTLFLAAAVVCAALLVVACNDTTGNNSNAGNGNNTASGNNNNASKPADSKPADSKPADTIAGGEIGVPECDAFLKKYEACLNEKVPEAQRGAMKPGLDAWKKSWKDLAANPQTKGSLKAACQQAETQSKQSMSAFGCSW